jgi:hypothetical protein
MGTRRRRQRQEELWYRRDLAEAPGLLFRGGHFVVFPIQLFLEHSKLGSPSYWAEAFGTSAF